MGRITAYERPLLAKMAETSGRFPKISKTIKEGLLWQ